MPVIVTNGTNKNGIRLNHKCNELATTSKSRGHKHVILFLHFLHEDTGLIHKVSYSSESTLSKRGLYIRAFEVLVVDDMASIWGSLRFSLRQDKFSQTLLYKEYACLIYIAVCTCYKQKAHYFILHLSYILEFWNSGTNFIDIRHDRGLVQK